VAELHRPAGSLVDGHDPVALTPEGAGWTFCGLRVLALAEGERRIVETGPDEAVVLPLSTTGLSVEADGERFVLAGRPSVFARVSDFAYFGRDTTVTFTAASGGEVAMATARCGSKRPPRYGPAEAVSIELRGAGQSTRQVTNFFSPDAWPDAGELMCVEVMTPDGNWSSYPPHKHDESGECPVQNEEIYYFRIGRAGETGYAGEGFGLHRLYTGDGGIDETVEVRDGDVFLIPRGYHGPCVAAPGYSMYYLNVLAGPTPGRSMAFCDDPAHHWVRDTWEGMPVDPRCPMTSAEGVVHA
jgi:5-deoxy-glucuronate isomerase